MKKIILISFFLILNLSAFGQYEVKTVKRPDGITLNYFKPIPVIRAYDYEAGLSLYKNKDNNKYFIVLTVLFKGTLPEELTGNLIVQTTGKNGLSLEPVYHKLVSMNGRDAAVSMYSVTERDINQLKRYQVKLISFNKNEETIALNLTENRDILVNEFSILSNVKSNISEQISKNSNLSISTPKQNPTKRSINTGTPQFDTFEEAFNAVRSGKVNTGLGKAMTPTLQKVNTNDVDGSINKYQEDSRKEELGANIIFGIIAIIFLVVLTIYILNIHVNKNDSSTNKVNENKKDIVKNENRYTNAERDNPVSKNEIEKQSPNFSNQSQDKVPEIKVENVVSSEVELEKIKSKEIKIDSAEDSKNKELKRIGFNPSTLFNQIEPYQYPMVKMPKENSYIKFPRLGRSNKLGFTENAFFEVLNKYFKSDFKVHNDRHIIHKNGCNLYEPDFLLINEKENKNIFINIEIDEPYDGVSRIPTHEIYRDVYRDLFFTNRGYVVIRFTEKQIFEEGKQCCAFISNVIKSIDKNYSNNELDSTSNASVQDQWDTLQSKKWSFEKYRENYLGIKSFNPKSSSQFEFAIENSELDKILESQINEIDISIFNKNDNKPLNGNQSHIRDNRVAFDSLNHKYYIDNNPDTISVSELIDKFFPEFDALKAAKNLNPNHELYGMPIDKIISIWKAKGNDSAELGTNLHLQIENYYKKLPYNPNSKEFKYFLEFKERFASMNPERTEWRIFDEKYMIAGTIDMLYKKEDGTYYIFDWKRSEKVVNSDGKPKISDPEHFYTKFAYGELGHLTDDSYYRYALQQNIYRHILETRYNCSISSMNLLILHPNYETYHWVKLPKMQKEVEYMLHTLKQIT